MLAKAARGTLMKLTPGGRADKGQRPLKIKKLKKIWKEEFGKKNLLCQEQD